MYAEGLDLKAPVGLVVYLDGDYWLPALSRFHAPRGRTMRGLAAVAAEHNAALVAVDTPDRLVGLAGFTWWVGHRENARWLRGFLGEISDELICRPRYMWIMGYSGGAEFISFELPRLITGVEDDGQDPPPLAGAIMVGGGGPWGRPAPPDEPHADLPLLWWVGARDGSPEPPRVGWSAAHAARQGVEAYRAAGWTGAVLQVVPGAGHRSYNLPAILAEALGGARPA